MKPILIAGVIIEEEAPLSLEELSQATHSDIPILIALIENELIIPSGHSPETWRFDSICLQRARRAISFYQELQINLQGVALALDLLDKIEQLQQEVNRLEEYEK